MARPRSRALLNIQKATCSLYNIHIPYDINDFLRSKEVLESNISNSTVLDSELQGGVGIIKKDKDTAIVGVYINPSFIQRLDDYDPFERICDENFRPFLTAVEEIDHFNYIADRLEKDRRFNFTGVEFQGELTKFALTDFYFKKQHNDHNLRNLKDYLMSEYSFLEGIDSKLKAVYKEAQHNAAKYIYRAENSFLRKDDFKGFLEDLRKVWRMHYYDKLSHIRSM